MGSNLDSILQSLKELGASFEQSRKDKADEQKAASEDQRSKLLNQLTQQQIDQNSKTATTSAGDQAPISNILGKFTQAQQNKPLAQSLGNITVGNPTPSAPAGASTSLDTGETTLGTSAPDDNLTTTPESKYGAIAAGKNISDAGQDVAAGQAAAGNSRMGLLTQLGGLQYSDNPKIKAATDILQTQDKADQDKELKLAAAKSKNGNNTLEEAANWKNQFMNDPLSRQMVELYAKGYMRESEAMAKVPGFNKQSGPARLALTQAAIELNPPQYDDQGNLTGGFNPRGFGVDWINETSTARKEGTLTPGIIRKEATLTGAKKRAELAPDIVEGQIEKSARTQTAKTLNNQRAAAQRALSTFDDSIDDYGDYQNIPDWMYRDLASDYVKVLQATGQIAEGSVDKVKQQSLQGDIVGLWNTITGDTQTTAPQKVLKLMHHRIRGLNTDLDKQYYNQTKGANLPVNSDESTNPLRSGATSQPEAKAFPGAPPVGTKKGGYTFLGGNPNDKNNWKK
jgi:hypothetical protein